MTRLYKIGIIATLVVLLLIEGGSFLTPQFGKIGVIIWIFSFIFILAEAVYGLANITQTSIAKKSPFLLIVLIIFIFITLFQTTNILNSNSETTQEITCALNNFSTFPDFGYRKTCLFGYPARQLFIPSIPSFFFGRDIIFLNIGSTIYFISGLIIFSSGLLKFFKNEKYIDLISAIVISSIFHFYFVNWFLFGYEQSIFPLSFSLIATGLLLSITHRNYYQNLGLIGIVSAYLIFSYTTGLFFISFIFGVLLYLLFFFTQNKNEKRCTIFILIAIAIFTASSLFFRKDINIGEDQSTPTFIFKDSIATIRHLIFGDQRISYTSILFQFIFLISLFVPLLTKNRKYFILPLLWIIGVIFLSIASKGYAYYSVDFKLHRAMVIIPVFLVFFAVTLSYLKLPFVKKGVVYFVILSIFFVSGIYYQMGVINSKQNGERHRHISFILWLKHNLPEASLKKGGKIMFDDSLMDVTNFANNYTSIYDSMKYYMPGFETCSYSNCPNYNNSDIYYVKNSNSYILGANDTQKNYGTFIFNGKALEVFK